MFLWVILLGDPLAVILKIMGFDQLIFIFIILDGGNTFAATKFLCTL